MTKEYSNEVINLTSVVIDKYYAQCLEITTDEHYKTCNCQRDIYEKYEKLFLDKEKEILKEKGESDENIINHRREIVIERAHEAASKFCKQNNIRCSNEKDEIVSTLALFVSKYESSLDDPIFIEVVKSVLNHLLVVHRLKKVISDEGVITRWTDRNDNERISVSPLLEAQREFDKIKVDALMLLDKKLNGEKNINLNMNVGLPPVPVDELFGNVMSNTDE